MHTLNSKISLLASYNTHSGNMDRNSFHTPGLWPRAPGHLSPCLPHRKCSSAHRLCLLPQNWQYSLNLQGRPPQGRGKSGSTDFCGVSGCHKAWTWLSFCRVLSRLPSPSISIGASHVKGRSMMVCGTLFSSQICLKVAAMPSAFPIPATTHWHAGGLPPARPALWTGTAPLRYRVPDSPAPIHSPPIQLSLLPRKELYTPLRGSMWHQLPKH